VALDRPTVYRGRLARAARFGAAAEDLAALRRCYYAARARDYLRTWLESDPAPSPEHRAALAEMLLAGGADAAA
jgi:hypothetical protein